MNFYKCCDLTEKVYLMRGHFFSTETLVWDTPEDWLRWLRCKGGRANVSFSTHLPAGTSPKLLFRSPAQHNLLSGLL